MRTQAVIGTLLAALALAPVPAVAAAPPAPPASTSTTTNTTTTASATAPTAAPAKPAARVLARITIPRLKLKHRPIREGVSRRVLARGIGHYPRTAMPGRIGNAVLLGHRTTYRAPFHDLDRLRRGDRIIVRVGRTTHTFRAYGKRIISPRNTSVLAPVPFRRGRAPRESVLTLISCHPKGSDRKRIVVLARKEPPPPRPQAPPPPPPPRPSPEASPAPAPAPVPVDEYEYKYEPGPGAP
ncbi:class E sortase [Spirillospora sp. CA-255316]